MSYGVNVIQGPNQVDSEKFETKQWGPLPGMTEEEFAKLASSILIVVPHRYTEGISSYIADKFGIWARFGTPFATVRDPHGGFVEVMRAGVVRTFLEYTQDHPNIRYLVTMDNDQSIGWDDPYKLARWDKPIVSGVVCAFNSKRGVFACFTVKDKNGIPRFPSYGFTRKMPADGLVEANHVGGGLLCIRRDVLERFVQEYKAVESNGPGCLICNRTKQIPFAIPPETRLDSLITGDLRKGEDIVFSEQCEKLGIKRYVDLSVRVSHFKTLPLSWPMDEVDKDLKVEDWIINDQDQPG